MKLFRKNKIAGAIVATAFSATLLGSSALLRTQEAHAQIPVTDAGSLMQMVQDGIMRAMESEIMQTLQETAMDMTAMFSEMEIDNVNNAFSNMIARTGKAMQDIQNMEQLEKSMPARDVCDTVQLSVSLDDMLCDMEAQVHNINSQTAGARAMGSGQGTVVCPAGAVDTKACVTVNRAPTIEEVSKYNATAAKETVETCKAISARLGRDVCTEASLMVSPPPQGTTADEYTGIMEMNKLAANVLVVSPRADASANNIKETPAHDKMVAADMRDTYFKSSFYSALNQNTMIVHGTLEADGTRKPGDMMNLERYLQTRLGSQNWLCEVTNSCASAGTNEHGESLYVSPAELEKRKAQMDAVLLYLGLQQYKSSLRIEKILADIALMELDPPKK